MLSKLAYVWTTKDRLFCLCTLHEQAFITSQAVIHPLPFVPLPRPRGLIYVPSDRPRPLPLFP